ncbi:Hint domain-containing protein [Sulfitobacter guttiformis]|uniref:Hint domain-containing protein n=1 Tax=Sulfitobacter guttiformis TaxID=74349 RepID=A0A420DRN0_9RHOB|nr:Hint domain-containing protein [Sulfitobacter guttiformis]KIN74339.1 Type I secretion target repeat protein [Sulfitobacter guttiformis KCTC 32187]RKE96936.1 Hint domain-containing protein [Sulfitobacter guttiformis]
MPTTYRDQYFTIDPGNPPGFGTAMTVQRGDFVDNNDNGQINSGTAAGDTFNGIAITSVWRNDTVTIRVNGVNITYRGVTLYLAGGNAPIFTPNDGQALQNGTFVRSTFVTTSTNMPVGTFGPTCFTSGAQIEVQGGKRAVEEIAVGDMVKTLDHGMQPVRMVLRQTVRAHGKFAPVLFEVGSIGNDRAFMVSPEHRMLISDWRAELVMGCDDVLVSAKHLVNNRDVRVIEGGAVEYFHLLFDSHQIVFADGCPSESCLPCSGLASQSDGQQAELLELFPNLADMKQQTLAARTVVRRSEAVCLMAA